ncbi:MarR family winged helix-turn-helix transcriptional regulator [Adhaeribacter pallidiroseus]|uniref:HTH marR-type domain-containing protein n=1 Tax=Adhaeribacter pallidiroseus TaxID=2072847 RepID=A0A369QHH4_9BACT|nr:hypothetical protein [Adhaeribacter pallidiroseus]RDC63740.1 hypothetical protein AHMF7616_02348 [Adhaeribacter pallidiroseus]
MKSKDLPIGYWIKQVDCLLTQGIDKIQAAFNFSRTDWQILNAINENPGLSKPDLTKLMLPFADNNTVEAILLQFHQKGITEEDFSIRLTRAGKEMHQACLSRQIAFRKQSMQHITESDYQTTVATLRQLVTNLNPS